MHTHSSPITILFLFCFYYFFFLSVCTGTSFDRKEGIIIVDSIGKHFRHLTKAVTSVHPGITISNLVHKIKDLNLKNYKSALLLVGTNDLTPKATWQWYKEKQRHGEPRIIRLPPHSTTPSSIIQDKYRTLILEIRKHNPNICLLVSAILPRVFDFSQNKDYLIEVNKKIEQLCLEFQSCSYLCSYKPLMKNGKPIDKYYSWDGLHLTPEGSKVLQRFFMGHMVPTLKSL